MKKDIENQDWLARWAGSYTFISCSYWSKQYYKALKKQLGVHFDHSLFIHKRGSVAFYIPYSEFSKLGKYLAAKSEKDISFVKNNCKAIKENADKLSSIMERLSDTIPSQADYNKFLKLFDKHLALHVFIKKAVDFLSSKYLDRLLPYFQGARLYTESIYSESEKFFRSIAKAIAKKESYNADYLTCLTQEEFEKYIKSQILPNKKILKQRYYFSILCSEKGKTTILTGDEAKIIERLLFSKKSSTQKQLKGVSAYKGKIDGMARVILDPRNVKVFNKGDILITGMTRPEFMPLIKKAAAIVTDVGGVLSHAAITAREFKIPTIVGTGTATKVFKDGETISINADEGTVCLYK